MPKRILPCSGCRWILAVVVALGSMAPQRLQAENMADALVGAYNSSGLLEQNRAVLRAADEDVALSMALLRPVVDWTTSVVKNWNETGLGGVSTTRNTSNFFTGLSLSLLIYDGGAS